MTLQAPRGGSGRTEKEKRRRNNKGGGGKFGRKGSFNSGPWKTEKTKKNRKGVRSPQRVKKEKNLEKKKKRSRKKKKKLEDSREPNFCCSTQRAFRNI